MGIKDSVEVAKTLVQGRTVSEAASVGCKKPSYKVQEVTVAASLFVGSNPSGNWITMV